MLKISEGHQTQRAKRSFLPMAFDHGKPTHINHTILRAEFHLARSASGLKLKCLWWKKRPFNMRETLTLHSAAKSSNQVE